MRNEPNFSKSQMFITLIKTTNYNKKWTLDTWSKRTQTNPTCGEQAQRVEPFYSELACTEQGRSVEPNLPDIVEKSTYKLDVHPFYPYAFS